jgi:hypothetical protein
MCLLGSEAPSLSSAGSIGIWRGGIRPAASGVGIYGGGRWWVAPESADGLRAKAGCNPGATRGGQRRGDLPDLSLPVPRVFLLAFFAVTATSLHPPTTATGIDR